ncbi:MAG TPA: amidohydrolase family protein [Myxococcota bacterium]|nr:amidohydrolase family protein [Myxococcota bacterium]
MPPPDRRSRPLGRRLLLALLGLVVGFALAGLYAWRALAPPPPLAMPAQGAVLGAVTVVNPGQGRAARRSVVVEGGRIAAIRDPQGSDPGRWADRTVLPGLIDMHVHFPPPTGLGQTELFALLFLAHGVTTVRDAGDVDGTATAPARDGPREGRFPGPRVYACGPFLDGPEPLWKNSIVARDFAQGAAAVERIADAGLDCVKAYDQLPPEALAGVKEQAAKRGLPVIGHVPRRTTYFEAALDDVQHLTGFARRDDDLRPFPQVLDTWPAFDRAAMAQAARRTAAAGIANTPTMVVVDRLVAAREIARAGSEPDVQMLPRLYRDALWTREGNRLLGSARPEDFDLLEQVLARELELVRALHAAGAELHVGTDVLNPFVVPGAAMRRELELFVEAGLTPEDALAAATTVPGKFLGREQEPLLGTVAEGAPADLLVFRRDPTADLANLDTIEAVIADGRLYTREMLEEQRARYDEYARGWLFDRVSVEATRRLLARLAGDGALH